MCQLHSYLFFSRPSLDLPDQLHPCQWTMYLPNWKIHQPSWRMSTLRLWMRHLQLLNKLPSLPTTPSSSRKPLRLKMWTRILSKRFHLYRMFSWLRYVQWTQPLHDLPRRSTQLQRILLQNLSRRIMPTDHSNCQNVADSTTSQPMC